MPTLVLIITLLTGSGYSISYINNFKENNKSLQSKIDSGQSLSL